jgi:hypothetical protein
MTLMGASRSSARGGPAGDEWTGAMKAEAGEEGDSASGDYATC